MTLSDVTTVLPDEFSSAELAKLEENTQSIGQYLFDHLDQKRPYVFQRQWWDDRIMDWARSNEQLKVELFRFVDVLPMLKTSGSIVGHLVEYLGDIRQELPMPMRVALGVAHRVPFTRPAVARAIKLGATDLARKFIAGANTKQVLAAALRERKMHRGFTLDILGEAVTSEKEARHFFDQYISLLEDMAPVVNGWEEDPQVDKGVLGPLPRFNLSVKLSAMDSQFDPIDIEGATRRTGARLRELLRVARQHKAYIHVDMESYDKKDLTLHVFKQVLMEEEFRDVGDVGIVIQAYLRDSAKDIIELRDWARERGKPVWVRLVKGAYWDYETIHAQATGWPIPVYQKKWHSDANFERLARFMMRNYDHLRPAVGTHNLRSLAHSMAIAEHVGLPRAGLEVQMLYGMADAEKRAIVEKGHRMRIYMPYGELIPGMAYLVRRLLENTSNNSFLRVGFVEHAPIGQLLRVPGAEPASTPKGDTLIEAEPDEDTETIMPIDPLAATYENEPPVDFALAENRERMQQSLTEVAKQLGRHYPLRIDGRDVDSEDQGTSVDPGRNERIIGSTALASAANVDEAVSACQHGAAAWLSAGVEQRATILEQAANLMRARRFELAAWEVYECGKGWREATADVDEAIDFCQYYAQQARLLFDSRGADVPGEENRFEYLPRGVCGVIAPWNFPLAILTGMTAAALVCGNPVLMKPAEQSPITAALLYDILIEAGVPTSVVHYLPGIGEVAGARMVDHPQVSLIAFTGSRAVGMAIYARAAKVSAQAPMVKKVIAEMGGKNAIIVDSDADLDEAVLGVRNSAFGFQGQKCSACSRAIVLEEAYDVFLARLVESTKTLRVGPAEDPATDVGPVIDQEAADRIHDFITSSRKEHREALSVDPGSLQEQGYYIGPQIFADVAPNSRLCQQEIFGPVLAVVKAKDFDEAIEIANGTQYALSGGIFSRSPAHLERARHELMVGNLYLNRGITGALVGRQPFGGFRMSGIGSKAGGAEYLTQFVIPRTITENTMRRGFAPE